MSQIEPLCLGAMILVFVGNSNLITAVFPLSCFLYAVVMPRRALWFWKFITWYLIAEIMLKMLIQLPLFCSTPAWGMWECSDEELSKEQLFTRYDFIIGIFKFYGPASYPRD